MSNRPKEYKIEDVTITLKRKFCPGFVPVYKFKIHGTGTIEYLGELNVKVKGKATWKIDKKKVFNLLKKFYEIDFFSLEEKYCYEEILEMDKEGLVSDYIGKTTCGSDTIVELKIGKYKKSVCNYDDCAPKGLISLEKKIDKFCNSKKWVGDRTEIYYKE